MQRGTRILFATLACIAISPAFLFGQRSGVSFHAAAPSGSGFGWNQMFTPSLNRGAAAFTPVFGGDYFPSFGYYGRYFSPFLFIPTQPAPYPYMPNYWWTGAYETADPRQDGYNPSSGYPQGTVATLLLTTAPARSRITLDGLFVGTTDLLGPIQLPVGEHSLRVDAPGYEPSETVLKVEQPILEQLEVRLNPAAHLPKPGPQQ